MAEQIRVWKSKNLHSTYMLVYRDELTGGCASLGWMAGSVTMKSA